MAIQTTTNIDVDFYDKKYILINAKQLDKKSRFLSVTCYNKGEPFIVSAQHSAYIRYKKADEHSVFNKCTIDKGKVIVELTEQMLAASGICYADLMIIDGGSPNINNDGEIVGIENSSILSTMTFCIDVSETAIDNAEIESKYEINFLDETLDRLEADYERVIKLARSWAVGGTGERTDENTNNAKFWADEALKNALGQTSVVTGIKCANDTDYRNGQVTINAYNVGAVSTNDVATVSEMKNFLGI